VFSLTVQKSVDLFQPFENVIMHAIGWTWEGYLAYKNVHQLSVDILFW